MVPLTAGDNMQERFPGVACAYQHIPFSEGMTCVHKRHKLGMILFPQKQVISHARSTGNLDPA